MFFFKDLFKKVVPQEAEKEVQEALPSQDSIFEKFEDVAFR